MQEGSKEQMFLFEDTRGTRTLPAGRQISFWEFLRDWRQDNRRTVRLIKSIMNNDNQKYLIFIWFTSCLVKKNLYSLGTKYSYSKHLCGSNSIKSGGFSFLRFCKNVCFFSKIYRVEKKDVKRGKKWKWEERLVNVCHRHIKPISSCYIIHIIYI